MESIDSILISIIIPVYNTERYLAECLDSVVNQTHINIEVLLIDNGSQDSSLSICKRYASKDSRIKIVQTENFGQGVARNTGLKMANGKYVAFLDSDDYYSSLTALDELCGKAEEDQLELLVFSAEPFGDGIDPQPWFLKYKHTVQNNIVRDGCTSFSVAHSNEEYYTQVCKRFYLLQHIKAHNFQFDPIRLHEDDAFSFLSYIMAERVECIGSSYYARRYRQKSSITTADSVKSVFGYSVAIASILSKYDEAQKKEAKKLMAQQTIRYLEHITGVFASEKALDRRRKGEDKVSRQISACVQKNIRKSLIVKEDLPRRLVYYAMSLTLGYYYDKYKRFRGKKA